MTISIRLDPKTEQRLDFLASSIGRTKAYCLREIMEYGLNDMEDYYLASDVLARFRKDQEVVHSTSDVRKALGLKD